MAIWSRKRRPSAQYVEPPEFRAGVIVIFDGAAWRLCPVNAGDGDLPAQLPTVTELTGERLADVFATSWRLALDGTTSMPTIERWIDLVSGPGREPAAAWGRFFADGGAMFRVSARRGSGIHARRYGWMWPATGHSPVWPSDKPADNIEIDESTGWRQAIEDDAGWPRSANWTEAAAWMRDRAPADPRAAAWWIADVTGAPRTAMMTELDAITGVRDWWAGETMPMGTAAVERYELPDPGGDGFWHAWLRWDPAAGRRPDGLADVLGLRRAGRGVDVVWWTVAADGRVGRPSRVADGPLDIENVEKLVAAALVFERPPPGWEWVEVDPR